MALTKIHPRLTAANERINHLLNGEFRVWQRGASVVITNGGAGYTADQWRVNAGATVSRQWVSGRYVARWAKTDTGFAGLFMQRVEGADLLNDKVVTIGCKIKVLSGTPKLRLMFQQHFGVGGDAYVNFHGPTFTPGGTEQRYTFTVKLNSTAEKNFASHSFLLAGIEQMEGTAAFSVEVGDFYLVEGGASAEDPSPTPRHIHHEIAMCQRYYCKVQGSIMGYNAAGQPVGSRVYFPVAMRTVPGVSVAVLGGQLNIGAPTVDGATVNSCRVFGSVSTTGTAYIDLLEVTANAEL